MFSISGSGFAPTVAPAAVRSAAVSPVMAVERSAAIPFLKRPPALDGSMVGAEDAADSLSLDDEPELRRPLYRLRAEKATAPLSL